MVIFGIYISYLEVGLVISVLACIWMISTLRKAIDEKTSEIYKYRSENERLQADYEKYKNLNDRREDSLNNFIKMNRKAFPHLAAIIADYKMYELDVMIKSLSWGHNAARRKKVASLIDIRRETKRAIEKAKIAEYELNYLKELYPVVEDILDDGFDSEEVTINLADFDPVRKYLNKEEYHQLSVTERNQLALDRYIESRKKSKWQIGRDYELFVGYKYECEGYSVNYFGSNKGLEDLGRDLIVDKDGDILVIQCKYWSKDKVIHEKHIAQLYGTYVCYCIENGLSFDRVTPAFVTSTVLSDMAKAFCERLNVKYAENYPLQEFPRIKCNIGTDENGQKTKIYHLPMDQQYDNINMEKKSSFQVFTVAEAEKLGFRRAYKWHGLESDK